MKTTIIVEFDKRVDRVLDLMGHIEAQCSEDEHGKPWADESEYNVSVKHSLDNTVFIYGQEFVFSKEDNEEVVYTDVKCPHLAKALIEEAKRMGYTTIDYPEDEVYSVGIKK